MVKRRTMRGAIPDSDGPLTKGPFPEPKHVVDTSEEMIGTFVQAVDDER